MPFAFGYDADGNPGWKDGADTVHPFKNYKTTTVTFPRIYADNTVNSSVAPGNIIGIAGISEIAQKGSSSGSMQAIQKIEIVGNHLAATGLWRGNAEDVYLTPTATVIYQL